MNNTNNLPLALAVVGLIAASALGITFGGKEVTTTTIDTSDRSTVERLETPQTVEQPVGGLVEVFRKQFPEGFVIGSKENENVFQTNSSNILYIGATSSDSDYAPIEIDIGADTPLVMRGVNFATSSLNWGGDFSVDRTFYVDQDADGVGFGTTTPAYMVELANAADAVLAITATSTNDAILRFNVGYTGLTKAWYLYVDNSDDDILKISTSTTAGEDILTIDSLGHLALIGTSTFTGNMTQTGTLTQSGGVVSMASTTIVGPLVSGGNICQVNTAVDASTTLTAAQMCDCSLIAIKQINTNSVSDTIFFASSTAMIADCIPNAGDTKETFITNNATSTLWITLAQDDFENAKLDIFYATSSPDADIDLQKDDYVIVKYLNTDNSSTTVTVIGTARQ